MVDKFYFFFLYFIDNGVYIIYVFGLVYFGIFLFFVYNKIVDEVEEFLFLFIEYFNDKVIFYFVVYSF